MDTYHLVGVRTIARQRAEIPPQRPGEALIEVAAVGICGSDLGAYRGEHPRMRPPLLMGHEFAGRISALGDDAGDFEVGDRVAVNPVISCGDCRSCLAGQENTCADYRVIGCRPELPGALAQFVSVPVENLHRLSEGCTMEMAAVVQPLAVSYHATVTRAAVAVGESVAILGAGPIGLGCLLVARAIGARTVVVDLDEGRLSTATAFGADAVVPARAANVAGAVTDALGTGVDVVLEAAGGRQTATLSLANEIVRPGGRIVVIGNFAAGISMGDAADLKTKELSLLGSQGYANESYAGVLAMVQAGDLDASALVSHRFALSQTPKAFELLDDDSQEKMKIIVASEAQ